MFVFGGSYKIYDFHISMEANGVPSIVLGSG